MRRDLCRIVVEPSGWHAATTLASQQEGRETGGILLGWRHTTGVFVSRFVEVADQYATRTGYLRRHALAASYLEKIFGELPVGSPIGYVGEWHTHPKRARPSWTDRTELKRISKSRDADIALIVAVYEPGDVEWVPVGLCARSGTVRPAVVEMYAPVDADPIPILVEER